MPEALETALTSVKTDIMTTIGDVAIIALPIFGLLLVYRIAMMIFKRVSGGRAS